LQDKDLEKKIYLEENAKYLEYEDDELHSLLLALLDERGIEPYKSTLCRYQQCNPPETFHGKKSEQFSKSLNAKGELVIMKQEKNY
jgi:hypothetical protein